MPAKHKCQACRNGETFGLPITMAFQPIVDAATQTIFAYEALLRGIDGQGADFVFSKVTEANRYAFDQKCRATAIELAHKLDLADGSALLSINFLPNAVYDPKACIRLTLEIAEKTGFPKERIMFEFTESERLDSEHILNILHTYRDLGFKTAIDDFGAGYSGLDLLSRFQPDVVKLDMALIRGIDQSDVKKCMVSHVARMLTDLGIMVVCEGVETQQEYDTLRTLGIELIQGYVIAKPQIEALPTPIWPKDSALPAA